MEIGLDEESRSKIRVERRRSLNQSVISAAERRRRIVERGSDRLDLITGKIRCLSASSSFHIHPDSSPLRTFPHHPGEADVPRNDEAPPSTLPIHGTSSPDHSTRGDSVEMDRAAMINSSTEEISHPQPLLVTPLTQQALTNVKPLRGSCRGCWPNLFTSKQIKYCILASEKTRACCALIIALLVVLSYIDEPLLGRDIISSESVIAWKPLYMVLLTNVTIVLMRLFLEKQRNLEEPPEQGRHEGRVDGDIWADAVNLLESGLVVYAILRALFIDCSIYLVVVVCGVSLV